VIPAAHGVKLRTVVALQGSANADPVQAASVTAGITADALLAALPDELRAAAVVASLLQTLGQTAVGTNDDAPVGESDEGVVSA